MSTFDPYDHFGFLTHRIARLIDLDVKPTMRKMGYDMPASCLGILADLWQKDGVAQKHLGSSLVKTKSSITKMLESLEANDLVTKKSDPDDKRNKLIYLTEKGRELKHKIQQTALDKEKQFLPRATKQDIEIAKQVLRDLYENLYKEKFNSEVYE